MQDGITLIIFALVTWLYFDRPLSWMQGVGFAVIALGAPLMFQGNP
jgi:uncharacterized protein